MDIFGLHLNRLLEDEFKTELRVRVVKNENLAEIEFHNTLTRAGRKSLLCRIHLPIQNVPLAVSRFRFRFQIIKLYFIFLALNPVKMYKIAMKKPLKMSIFQALTFSDVLRPRIVVGKIEH